MQYESNLKSEYGSYREQADVRLGELNSRIAELNAEKSQLTARFEADAVAWQNKCQSLQDRVSSLEEERDGLLKGIFLKYKKNQMNFHFVEK
jgi:predicted nuclease with TOPRIM domain